MAVRQILIPALVLAGCGGGPSSGSALVPGPNDIRHFSTNNLIGDPNFYFTWTVRVAGDRKIRLERAEYQRVPTGMVVDHVWAVHITDGLVEAVKGPEQERLLMSKVHELTDVLADPSCPASARCLRDGLPTPAQNWYLVTQLHSTQTGDLVARELRITYTIDGSEYFQTLTNIEAELDSGPSRIN